MKALPNPPIFLCNEFFTLPHIGKSFPHRENSFYGHFSRSHGYYTAEGWGATPPSPPWIHVAAERSNLSAGFKMQDSRCRIKGYGSRPISLTADPQCGPLQRRFGIWVFAGNPSDFLLKAGCPVEENPVNRPVMRVYRILTNMGQCWVLIWENA